MLFTLLLIDRVDAPAIISLHGYGVLRVGLFSCLVDKAFLNFWSTVEFVHTLHCFFDFINSSVEVVKIIDRGLDLRHHGCRESNLSHLESISIIDIEAENYREVTILDYSINKIVDFVAEQFSVTKTCFFLLDVLNLIDEFVLPAVKLDTFDVLEGLVDVEHSLVSLLLDLLVHVLLLALSVVADSKLAER